MRPRIPDRPANKNEITKIKECTLHVRASGGQEAQQQSGPALFFPAKYCIMRAESTPDMCRKEAFP